MWENPKPATSLVIEVNRKDLARIVHEHAEKPN
jgi:hypothetical protein